MIVRTAERDRVRLAYAVGGEAAAAVIFVHGGLSSHEAFAPQMEHFARVCRVLAPDLRGHGQSSAGMTPMSIEAMADDVAFLCDRERIGQAVTVGHSMGGLAALELARRRSDLTRALVLVESPIVPPEVHPARSAALLDALRGPDYRAFVEGWARQMVAQGAPYAGRITEMMRNTPQDVAVAVVESMLDYDSDAAVVACPVPMVVVGGQVDVARLHRLRPDAVALPPVGASHYGHLDAPDDLNAVIASVMARASAG